MRFIDAFMDELLTTTTFNEVSVLRDTLHAANEELAAKFLQLFWDKFQEAFPEIHTFGIEVDYVYNDNWYDIAPVYTINHRQELHRYDDNYWGSWGPLGRVLDEEATRVLRYWTDLFESQFERLFGKDYSFIITSGGVSCRLWERPSHIFVAPEGW